MKTHALLAALFAALAVPATLAVATGATDDVAHVAARALALGTEDGLARLTGDAAGPLRVVVKHTGADMLATLRISRAGEEQAMVVVHLAAGTNVVGEFDIPAGPHTATLNAIVMSGTSSVDVADCPGQVLETQFTTRSSLVEYGIRVDGPRCA